MEVANNIKKQGGAIPGIRQGRPTADFIKKVLGKITFVGAIFLSIIAVLPVVAGPHVMQHIIEWIMSGSDYAKQIAQYASTSGMSSYADYLQQSLDSTVQSLTTTFTFGGTTLLIMVGVAIETFRELEAQLTMRNYKGFLG
jgi:preprotein translocase subunit SecY